MVKVKYIWFFLSFLCALASCKKNNSECHNLNYIDNFEICTLSPPLSKYCYVIIHNNAGPDTSDTIQIYKTESNQILLFYRKHGLDTIDNGFSRKLFAKYEVNELYGKSIKDKRGGENNIHSWDLGIKGDVSEDESNLLNQLLKSIIIGRQQLV